MANEKLKIISVKFSVQQLGNFFPTLQEDLSKEDKINSFIYRQFRGSAVRFEASINEEEGEIKWSTECLTKDSEAWHLEAIEAAKKREFQKAAELWRKAVSENPHDPDLHYNLGLALIETKQYVKGLNHLKEALDHCPIYYRAAFVLGSLYSKQKQYEQAEHYIKIGLLFKPDYLPGWINLGAVSNLQKKHADAVKAFEKAVLISPKDAKAYFGLAKAYEQLEDFENAVRNYKAVIKLDPSGRLGQLAQETLASLPVAKSAAPLEPKINQEAAELLVQARQAMLNNDFSVALEKYRSYLKSVPNDDHALASAAVCCLRLAKKEEAVSLIEKSIKLSPTKGRLQKQAAIIYDTFGETEAAGRAAKRAIDLGKRDSVTLSILGIARFYEEKYVESIHLFDEALRENHNNLKARYYLAQALLRIGQRESARQHLEEILWSPQVTPLKEKARAMISEIIG